MNQGERIDSARDSVDLAMGSGDTEKLWEAVRTVEGLDKEIESFRELASQYEYTADPAPLSENATDGIVQEYELEKEIGKEDPLESKLMGVNYMEIRLGKAREYILMATEFLDDETQEKQRIREALGEEDVPP